MRISFEFTDGSKAEIEGDEIAGVELLHCGASASDGDRWELADLKAFGAQASEAFSPESSATEAPPASEAIATASQDFAPVQRDDDDAPTVVS